MIVTIDNNSGFCFGVQLAVEKVEQEIQKNGKIYCLEQIVHNDEEVKRLEEKGMVTINHSDLQTLHNVTVLIRAHGEPPETYEIAKRNNIKIIDASCPIVLNFQKKIIKSKEKDTDNQIVIFGKKNHPEVIGLSGQINYKAIIIEKEADFKQIDFNKPVKIFSQTTKAKKDYKELTEKLKKLIEQHNNLDNYEVNNTICSQVSGRNKKLSEFSQKNDVIVFVGGTKSSNAKTLYMLCKSVNERSYFISSVDQIEKQWFNTKDRIGICGATSTPKWLMEDAKDYILNNFNN